MTDEQRVQAVIDCGFTERQARFLVLVLRHAGVCVPRQYASFASIANGSRRCKALFDKLVRRGYANGSGCVHNRARLYQLHSKRLYFAIGEPNSRYRRTVPARAVGERLMLLDAVLTSPDLKWLTTESDKVTFLTELTAFMTDNDTPDEPVDTPSSGTLTELPGTFPIGVDPAGRAVLLYLATVPWTEEFRRFLQGHATLVRVAPAWTLRLVFPRPLDRAYGAYQTVVREELETPLQPATIRELKWYFERRRAAADQRPDHVTRALLERGLQVFSGPRFTLLYRRWLKYGDAVFESVSSPLLAEALTTGAGRVECVVLPHSYGHLSPLVNESAPSPQGVEKGLRRGNREGNRPPHALNPLPQPPPVEAEESMSVQLARGRYRLVEAHNAQKKLGLTR